MCKRTDLVLNCCGPYRTLGERVFSSCILNKTDYIDLCGEPAFIEQMEVKYGKLAEQNKVVAISGCGFDSVPSEMGVVLLQDHFHQNNFKLHGVEAFLRFPDIHPAYSGHATTWDCAVMGFANQQELRLVRKQLNLPKINGPSLKRRAFLSQIKVEILVK